MIEKLNIKECIRILKNNYIGYLSYIKENTPHIVPITYFFDERENSLIYYSDEGHKINAMRNYRWVSMLVTEIKSVSDWDSVLVHGEFNELKSIDAKAKLHDFSIGIKNLIWIKELKKMNFINEFSSKVCKGKSPVIFQIKGLEITGRKDKK